MADVLVFAAHPDDAEFGMGASLVKFKKQGLSIALCVLTDGQSGTHGTPQQRREEMQAAAEFLDADIEMLEWQDCAVHDTQENRCTIASVIRKYAPKTIFAPYYASKGGPDEGESHPDHSATGDLVKKAVRFARFKNMDGVEGEAHRTENIYYYMLGSSTQPTLYIDVSEHMDEWEELARCHDSQTALKDGKVLEVLRHKRKSLGMQAGCGYAEGFVSDALVALDDSNLL